MGGFMVDYKAMYYHLAGRMATAIEVLEYATDTLVGATEALAALTEKLKQAQQSTEDLFINGDEDDLDSIAEGNK